MVVDRYRKIGIGEGEGRLRRRMGRKGDGKGRSELDEVGEEEENNWEEVRSRGKEG